MKFIQVDLTQIQMGQGVMRIDSNFIFKFFNRLIELLLSGIDNTQKMVNIREVGKDIKKSLIGLYRFLILTLFKIDSSQRVMSHMKIRVYFQSFFTHFDRPLQIAYLLVDDAQIIVGIGKFWIDLKRILSRLNGLIINSCMKISKPEIDIWPCLLGGFLQTILPELNFVVPDLISEISSHKKK